MKRPESGSYAPPNYAQGYPHHSERIGLILSGGGARAAYQVGVLRAIATQLPKDARNPFHIISGTSAGALNAVSLATHAQKFRTGIRSLEYVWKNITSSHIYKLDSVALLSSASNWALSSLASRKRNTPVSLLNNEPLRQLLTRVIKFDRLQPNIDAGFIDAVSVTASGYSSGESVSFFQGVKGIENWQRPHRVGIRTSLEVDHLLASSAIPTIFPAVKINREYFGDGAIRQLSPLSPAIQMGTRKILAIGVSSKNSVTPPKDAEPPYPSLTEIIGHVLNSAFVDTLDNDLEVLRRFNEVVPYIPAKVLQREAVDLRPIDLLEISPTQNLNQIARKHFDELPRALKLFVKDSGSSSTLGLLLFEKAFCRELMQLGYNDAVAKTEEIRAFFDIDVPSRHAERNGAALNRTTGHEPQGRPQSEVTQSEVTQSEVTQSEVTQSEVTQPEITRETAGLSNPP